MRIEEFANKIGYRVSLCGICFSPEGVINKHHAPSGYKTICVKIGKEWLSLKIHRLQAFQKYGNDLYKKGVMTRHLNGNSLDNSYKNITIGTNSQNQLDVPIEDRIRRAKHAASFNVKHDKSAIVKYYNTNRSYKDTMIKFNISSKGTLWHILNK